MLIDALGGGLLGPLELLYGRLVVGLSLPESGAALTLAAGASILVGPFAGTLVDRLGARWVIVISNVAGALGCGLLLAAQNLWTFGLASFTLASSVRVFWAAYAPYVAGAVAGGNLERWFGWLRGVRSVGLTIGGLCAALILSLGSVRAIPALVVLDAASYLLAATLLFLVPQTIRPSNDQQAPEAASYRTALRDRPNLWLMLHNVGNTLFAIAPLMAMPIIVVEQLRLDPGLVGLLSAEATALLAMTTAVSGTVLRGHGRLGLLAGVNMLWLIACVSLALLAKPSLAAIGLFVGLGVLAVGEGVYSVVGDALPIAIAPKHLSGRYTALHQMAWGVSEAIAPTTVALLLTGGSAPLWIGLGVVAALNALGYARLQRQIGVRAGRMGESAPTVP